jgi:hypothetical protein
MVNFEILWPGTAPAQTCIASDSTRLANQTQDLGLMLQPRSPARRPSSLSSCLILSLIHAGTPESTQYRNSDSVAALCPQELQRWLLPLPRAAVWSALTPTLFISRMAPKSYSYEIIQTGGISWILGNQFYPFGAQKFADSVRAKLRLPVSCPARIRWSDCPSAEGN